MGARNEEQERMEEVMKGAREQWEEEGRIWEVNPPLASHFGGVWERAIGQVRQILQGYLVIREERVLSREEFETTLLQVARIINSTPLFEAVEDPNEAEPITPHQLITQRDDTCREQYARQVKYDAQELAAYGANHWKRTIAIVDEFET